MVNLANRRKIDIDKYGQPRQMMDGKELCNNLIPYVVAIVLLASSCIHAINAGPIHMGQRHAHTIHTNVFLVLVHAISMPLVNQHQIR